MLFDKLKKLPRYIAESAAWILFKPFKVKKNKVLLQSYMGRGFSDSPKAIALELLKRGGFELYWLLSRPEDASTLPEGVKPVKSRGISFVYHMSTAGFWIDNSRKTVRKKKKKSQIYIQTWHGFALKRIEKDAETALDPEYVRASKIDGKMCDMMISDSRHMTEIYKKSFWFDGEIKEFGLPRNDYLYHAGEEEKKSIKAQLGFGEEDRLVLYAPTFRADGNLECYGVDYDRLVGALSKRFGGRWTVLVKLHSNLDSRADELKLNGASVRNLSHYPDIQPLYVACDLLITDYSSVMFDYMLTAKPILLFAADLEDYVKDRNFYMPITGLPFELCRDNDGLCRAVENFDADAYAARLREFRDKCGIVFDGKASEKTVDWMKERIGI